MGQRVWNKYDCCLGSVKGTPDITNQHTRKIKIKINLKTTN